MNDTFLIGSAAFISSIFVFVGSVWLILALILGPRLSYLVTASTTLGFVLIMGVVWSIGTPLGPVGQLPEWNGTDIGKQASSLDFGPASDYPDAGTWRAPDENNAADTTQAGELESAATNYLQKQIDAGKVKGFKESGDAEVLAGTTRLLERDGETFGALSLGAVERPSWSQAASLVVVMKYDPGNPSGPARQITAGTLVLFVIHLLFLSRAEKTANKRKENEAAGGDA